MANAFKKPTRKQRVADLEVKSSTPVDDLYDRWKKEPEMSALNLSISYSKAFDADKAVDSLVNLFDKREVRRLVGRDYNIEDVGDHGMKEVATRSKVVGVHITVLRHLRRIEAARKQVKMAVSAGDSDWLTSNATTKVERDVLVETLLAEADLRISELAAVKEIAEMILADIDKTGFVLSMISNGLAIEFKTERKFTHRG